VTSSIVATRHSTSGTPAPSISSPPAPNNADLRSMPPVGHKCPQTVPSHLCRLWDPGGRALRCLTHDLRDVAADLRASDDIVMAVGQYRKAASRRRVGIGPLSLLSRCRALRHRCVPCRVTPTIEAFSSCADCNNENAAVHFTLTTVRHMALCIRYDRVSTAWRQLCTR
jgi:hypothetical protein